MREMRQFDFVNQRGRSHLHVDPYNWTGTNMVFSGIKLWKLYPPGQDNLLYVIPQAS